MKLVIGSKRNGLEMRPEKTFFAGQLMINAFRRTVTIQDLGGGWGRLKVGGAIDVVDQVVKAERLLFPLDVPMVAGLWE